MYRQFDHAGGGIQAKANREVLANVRRPAARFRYGEPGFFIAGAIAHRSLEMSGKPQRFPNRGCGLKVSCCRKAPACKLPVSQPAYISTHRNDASDGAE